MDFFNSLWDDPEQSQVPAPDNFAVDITAEKWMNLSSTYKLISGSFRHPHESLGIDQCFSKDAERRVKTPLDDFSRPSSRQHYEKKEKKHHSKHGDTLKTLDENSETDEGSEDDSELNGESPLSEKYVYVPGLRKNPVNNKLSCLDLREHAECLSLFKKFSKLTGSVIMPSDRSEHLRFEIMCKKVQDEQKEFIQDALNQWHERAKEVQNVPNTFRRILGVFWQIKARKALEDYPHFYKKISIVPLRSEDIKVEMTKMSDLLQMGKIPVFFQPALKSRTKSTTVISRMLESTQYNLRPDQVVGSLHKLPVSRDPNAESLGRLQKAHIVISSGALNTLVESHFNVSKEWTLPITVKEYRTIDKGKTTTKTVVFIDKKLPKQSMPADECYRFVNKYGLRGRVVGRRSDLFFAFPIPGVDPLEEVVVKSPNKAPEDGNLEDPKSELKESSTEDKLDVNAETKSADVSLEDDSDDEKLVIEEQSPETSKQEDKKVLEMKPPPCKTVPKRSGTGTPQRIQEPFKRKDGLRLPKTPDGFTAPLSNTNVTYSSWVIRPENEDQSNVHQKKSFKEFTVIVRCRVDACQKVKDDVTALSLSPKIECQLEFAGEEPTKEEFAREWASLNFKPASHLARMRVDFKDGELVMCEKKDKAQISADALRIHGIRLSDSLQTLYNVFSEVSTLTKGAYLLHHSSEDNAFASLEEETEDIQENIKFVRNLENYFGEKFAVASDPNPAWRKLDCGLVLPRHEVLQIMPGTYRPKPSGKAFVARNIPTKQKTEGKESPGFPPRGKGKKCKNKKKNIKKNKQNSQTKEE